MSDAHSVTWGLQHAFLPLLDAAANSALSEIGASLSPSALLVGFRDTVSPGPDRLVVLEVEGCDSRLDHPALAGDAGPGVPAPELEAALQAASGRGDRCFFAGQPVRVADYVFHPVLSVDPAAMGAVPHIRLWRAEGTDRMVSLAHELVTELLRSASQGLLAARAPAAHTWLPELRANDVVRRAAGRMVKAVKLAADTVVTPDLFESFEALASTAYEGRVSKGGVVLATREHHLLDVAVRLRSRVPVQDHRQFRKLLELTEPALDLLADGATVYGLGRVSPEYDGSTQSIFRFQVLEQGVWQLAHHGEKLLHVEHGRPRLPRSPISFTLFEDTMRRVFPDAASQDTETIWRLAEAVSTEPYGAMLVVSGDAEQEAARLAPESLMIEPKRIDAALLESLTHIDGAVLLTPQGVCHGIGVILDGIATGTGDPGRGARYNSAVRYATSSPAPCLIVIVSEDGMIDLHPEPEPQVSQGAGDRALEDLERVAAGEPVDLSQFYAASGRLRLLASQLSPQQCERANGVWRVMAERHQARTGLPLIVVPFLPRERPHDAGLPPYWTG